MKILHLYKDYYPVLGGIENHVKTLAEAQVAQGHQVEVLVNNSRFWGRRENINGVAVTKVGRWLHAASTPLSPWFPLQLYRRLYTNPPDIIHIQSPYPVSEASWLLGSYLPRFGRKRPRCVITYQSDVVKQQRILKYYAPVLRQVLRRADLIIASSPNYIATSPFLQVVKEKCRVVPLGIDTNRFLSHNPARVAEIQSQFPGFRLLFVGRLRYYKGLQYLLEALAMVSPTIRLIIVGIGPMETSLREQVARLGLGVRVSFVLEVSDAELPDFYAAAEAFVLPSCERSEAFGLVQVEAMAAGLPVISTELGTGTSYVNLHNQTGLVVPPANPTELAQAINMLATQPQLRLTLGTKARERVIQEFSLAKMARGVEEIYRELIKKP